MKKFKKRTAAAVLCLAVCLFSIPVLAFGPSSDVIYDGIDVSRYQEDIDFERVAASGVEVVYIRSSASSDYVDPYFSRNYQRAKAAGLKIGFYHAMSARNETEAVQEARFFVQTISGTQPDCKLAMDFGAASNLSYAQRNTIARAFLEETRRLSGLDVVIYSSAYTARAVWDEEMAQSYPIWVAEYGVDEPENGRWNEWVGFQYSNTGRVDGIDGNVDLDYFTEDILLSESSEIPHPENPQPDNPDNQYIYVRVERGDTLYKLAKKYDTTVQSIIELNNLSNPNLIIVGERLRIEASGDIPEGAVYYVVQRGDTLGKIARRYNTTVSEIAELNNLSDPDLIYVGQRLLVQGGTLVREYTVQRGDTLGQIAARFNTTVSRLAAINKISNINLIYPGMTITLS